MEVTEQIKAAERIKAGDFTQLASMYAKYRPGYSETVLNAFLGIINKPFNTIDFVDIGAGTGIWTRQLAKHGCRSVVAVDPNAKMRAKGISSNGQLKIQWLAGSAEKTPLPDQCADFITMASSFHWANFDLAVREIHRLLKPTGYFAMLWNPRCIDQYPLLQDIEKYIYMLAPEMKRMSSGKSHYVDELANKLAKCNLFEDMIYLEGRHIVRRSKEDYLGVWKSVNEVRSKLGEIKFSLFMHYVEDKIQPQTWIDCTYQTRAWIVKKKA